MQHENNAINTAPATENRRRFIVGVYLVLRGHSRKVVVCAFMLYYKSSILVQSRIVHRQVAHNLPYYELNKGAAAGARKSEKQRGRLCSPGTALSADESAPTSRLGRRAILRLPWCNV